MKTFTPFSVGTDRKANALNCIQFQIENRGDSGLYGESIRQDAAKIVILALKMATDPDCDMMTEDGSRLMAITDWVDCAAEFFSF